MKIYTAKEDDLEGLLKLYTQFHGHDMPPLNEVITSVWQEIRNDKNHHVIVGKVDGMIVSSCVLMIIPNLNHDHRPYGLIENVITDEGHRGQGYATEILNYAREIAVAHNCYKIMLMTGSKKESTLNFYRKAGYNSEDKTAFIQWFKSH